jgi:uncharacterized membrane protein HdeD (DUF308 family)
MLCASAAAVGFLGALSLITGIILVIGDQWLPSDWYAIGALLVAVAAALIMWIFVRRAMTTLSDAQEPTTEGVVARAD